MEVTVERGCGLDVHKKRVVACVMTCQGSEVRTFGTMTRDLLELADWLREEQVTVVAMESTGVYWWPIFNLLESEESLNVMVVNARHIKAVPGRKTDVKDSEWIADLLRHGLLKSSFIPKRDQRELRELVRYRRKVVEERADASRRIQKLLEGANIKLGDVASDVLGVSGRQMLKALAEGKAAPAEMAEMARGRLRPKRDQLRYALEGTVGQHQRFMLRHLLGHVDFLEGEIAELYKEVESRLSPLEASLQLLSQIPGLSQRTAEVVVAEIGVDMSRFPSSDHLASWAGLCPGNDESAGKRRSGRTRPGNKTLKSTLVEAAKAAARVQDSYFAAQYRRLAARLGPNRASVAVAHSLLRVIYAMLSTGDFYHDLGADFFTRRDRDEEVRRSTRRLEKLGYRVTLEDVA